METPEQLVEQIDKAGKKCWLCVGAVIYNHDAVSRDPETNAPLCVGTKEQIANLKPMKRFAFRGDVSTSLDGEIIGTDVRIIYNRHQKRYYTEDAIFASDEFSPGKIVSLARFIPCVTKFAQIANARAASLDALVIPPELTTDEVLEFDLIQPIINNNIFNPLSKNMSKSKCIT